ncbi:DHH family phosphoesterase [Flavobacterium aciduliphilum]|uniref:Phosphoesterase RecJ-like protein n=1 Tax=Flavobacterium aciduliphilum TaxID=1101402 RepID=A0A328YA17_9FLAO|nr:bifunctional oligoribonuclease/PAP phosphatase NrnA [Flavobacterium aciduliphilum]RAR70848.1 phosphoesterase RecJ-like protein [Flavobacterium aciduliphilum]
MKETDIIEIQKLLASPKKIAIIPHRNPDGDAMGSTLGLYHFLVQLHHEAFVVSPNDFPNFLSWMPGSENVYVFENAISENKKRLQEAELIFTLDFNALHRTGEMEHTLAALKVPMIMIDHHEAPAHYATYVFSDTAYGSTCEMVYDFIAALGKISSLNKTIATCLYTGIMTDSGQFRFPKTTGKTHRIVAEFIDLGVANSDIPNLIFDNNSYDRLQLLGRALQNMKVFPELKTSYTTLSNKELAQFNYVKGDTEGIVNYGLTIKGIHFTAIFIEHSDENIIKISFRSQGAFDVNTFARTYFDGGGHQNAAGGRSYDSLEHTLAKFEKIIQTLSI